MLNQEQEQIVEFTGAQNWNEAVEWFGDMTPQQRAISVEDIWPNEPNNQNLIELINSQMK